MVPDSARVELGPDLIFGQLGILVAQLKLASGAEGLRPADDARYLTPQRPGAARHRRQNRAVGFRILFELSNEAGSYSTNEVRKYCLKARRTESGPRRLPKITTPG